MNRFVIIIKTCKWLYDRAVALGKVWDDLSKFRRAVVHFFNTVVFLCSTYLGVSWLNAPAPAKPVVEEKVVAPLPRPEEKIVAPLPKPVAPAKASPNCISDSLATVHEALTNADNPREVTQRHYENRDVCNALAKVIATRPEGNGLRVVVETREGLQLVALIAGQPPLTVSDKVRITGRVRGSYNGPKDEPRLQLSGAKVVPCLECPKEAKEEE